MTFRTIPVIALGAEPPPKRGSQPGGVVWLTPADLMIDTRYQREIGPRGEARIREIALNFDWRKFTPVIVARVNTSEELGYAVIDGQHRVAAVMARGDIARIPAWVIEADVAQQAGTFLSINAESARIPSGAMVYARAAAGDKKACELLALCAEVRIEVLKYAVARQNQKFNQTSSPGEILASLRCARRPVVLRALSVLRDAGEAGGRPLLTRRMIRATMMLIKHNAQWADDRSFAAVLSALPVEKFDARATILAREKGGRPGEHFLHLVREFIVGRMKVAA